MSQINREDALNVLKIAYDTCGADIDTFYKTAMGAIKTLPSAESWIPCKERLPEVEVRVLTCYAQGFVETNFLVDDTEELWMYGNDIVVAWKPLPKPYGEEK